MPKRGFEARFVRRTEKQVAGDGQFARIAAAGAGSQVFEQDGAGFRAIGDPELLAGDAIVGREVYPAVECGKARNVAAAGAGFDVPEQGGTGGCAVGDPGFGPVDAVVGSEQDFVAESDEMDRLAVKSAFREGVGGSRVEIGEQGCGLAKGAPGKQEGQQKSVKNEAHKMKCVG